MSPNEPFTTPIDPFKAPLDPLMTPTTVPKEINNFLQDMNEM